MGSRLFLAPTEEEAEEAEEALLAWGTLVERGLAKSTSSSDLWLGATIENKNTYFTFQTIIRSLHNIFQKGNIFKKMILIVFLSKQIRNAD